MEKQTVLLDITEDAKSEALFMSKTFVDADIKRRVYVNTLGAECFMQYLADNGIKLDNLHNIHSITRVVEKADIADILLNNIHIDVRVIFDENKIFIPKNHKKYGLTPDIYVVLKIGSAPQALELLGYFKPEIIDENNSNKDYFFVTKNELSAPETLYTFIKNAKYSNEKSLNETEMLRGRELSILNADHDITDAEFKEYMGLLLSNHILRDSVSEFDNFETLSYDVIPVLMNEETFSQNEEEEEEEEEEENTEAKTEDETQDDEVEDDTIEEKIDDEIKTETKDETEENIDTLLDDFETFEAESLDTKETESVLPDVIKDGGAAIAGTAAVAGIAGAAGAVSDAITSGAATGEAIELAGNAGDVVEDLLDNVEDKKEEPVPEITLENITLDDNLDIEPLEIDDLTTEIPLETTNNIEPVKEETPSIEVPPVETTAQEEQTEAEDILDDFEEFEKLAEPTDEIVEDTSSEILPSELLTEDEIEVTEPPAISESLDNSISPTDDEELFKDSAYDELFDESNPQEPTYNYAEHNKSEDDFLKDFEDFEKAGANSMAFENNASISDKNIRVGEIPIDINNMQEDVPMPSEHLENIYNDSPDMVTDAPLRNSVMIGRAAKASNGAKKGVLAGVGALVLLAGITFGTMKYLKPADPNANAPLPPTPQPQTAENNAQENQNTLDLTNNNVVNMNNNSSTVNSQTTTAQQPAKKMAATAFMSVRKLSWEVPDYISYNAAFKQYFQSAGKSLKSALSSDLLLADEYAYTDQVRVSVLFDKIGTFKEAKILLSSGSAQIDKIVLQSVNQTLSILKAPPSVGNDESTTVILKIYF